MSGTLQIDDYAAQVPALLPASAPAPAPLRRISVWKGLFLFWLLPRRLGPHLAAGAMWRAILANVFTILAVLWIVVLATDWVFIESWAVLRVKAAQVVLQAAQGSSLRHLDWPTGVDLDSLFPLGAAELLFLCSAMLLLPWCADGDRARSALRRSINTGLWSSTILVPCVGAAALLNHYELEHLLKHLGLASRHRNEIGGIADALVWTVPVLVWLRMLAGGCRYVGPPKGPGFSPREPRCEHCGYLIVGMPTQAKCPECGTPVRESLPGGRRCPAPWQASGQRGALAALLRLQRRALLDRDFLSCVPMRGGLNAARRFWWGTYLSVVGANLLVARLAAVDDEALALMWLMLPVAVLAPLLLQSAMVLAGCLYAHGRHHIVDYRVSAIICCYAAPMMWPLVLLHLAWFFVRPDMSVWLMGTVPLPVVGTHIDGFAVLACLEIGLVIVAALTLIEWWRRVSQALAAARYANM